jgi:ribosomal protein S27E
VDEAKMSASNEHILNALTAGCTEKEFVEMRCTKCGNGLRLFVHPKGKQFFVRCPTDNTHLAMHGEAHSPPEWWERYRGPGWISGATASASDGQ